MLAQDKLDWKSWGDAGRAALQDLTREMIIHAVLNPLKNLLFGSNQPTLQNAGGLFGQLFSGGLGDLFGGGASGSLNPTTSAAAVRFHSGSLVGHDGVPVMMRSGTFSSAPRFHDGAYLKPDEVPVILQRGECVLNRKEAQAYERGDPRSSGAVVNVTIQTPYPTAFDDSRTQIAAGLARAVRSGMLGM